MQPASFHKSHVAKALRKLSDLASQANVMVELALCHGTVIAVAHTMKHCQRGNVRPNDIVVRLAESVYDELRLRIDWLEIDVARFISEAAASHTLNPGEFAPGVLLSLNSSADALAKKLHLLGQPLPRDSTDAQDAEYLLGKIRVSSPDQILCLHGRVFPCDQLSDTATQLIDRVFRGRTAACL